MQGGSESISKESNLLSGSENKDKESYDTNYKYHCD